MYQWFIIIFLTVIFIISISNRNITSKDNFDDPSDQTINFTLNKHISGYGQNIFSFLISNSIVGSCLYSLSNLPKNQQFLLNFNDLTLSFKSDLNGNYTFIKPLPLYLITNTSISLSFDSKDFTGIVQGVYKKNANNIDIGNINIKLTMFYPKIFKKDIGNTPETGKFGYITINDNAVQPYEDTIRIFEIIKGQFDEKMINKKN